MRYLLLSIESELTTLEDDIHSDEVIGLIATVGILCPEIPSAADLKNVLWDINQSTEEEEDDEEEGWQGRNSRF